MKKIATVLCSIVIALTFSTNAMGQCTTIQDGALTYSETHYLAGQPLMTGFDAYGYNYQAHMFSGSYANVYLGGYGYPPYEGDDVAYYERLVNEEYAATVNEAATLLGGVWCWPYRDADLLMKWNDSWLSNEDCDDDTKLDRYYGYESYIGSGAWETNHQSGTYLNGNGKKCKWVYFVKIVAVPADAYYVDSNGNEKPDDDIDIWYTASGVKIGPSIWGSFATIQQVYNDPCDGYHGIEYLSPAGPGFGHFQ